MIHYKVKKQRERTTMNNAFADSVYTFTEDLFKNLLQEDGPFHGKTVGEEGCTMDDIMKHLFGDFEPGKKAPKVKKSKKKKSSGDKKKRALSGYTFFGREMKDTFAPKIKELEKESGERVMYIKYQATEWKKLSDGEKEEWGKKAKAVDQKEKEEVVDKGDSSE